MDLEWARLEELVQEYQNLVLQAYQETENALIGFSEAYEEKRILAILLQKEI